MPLPASLKQHAYRFLPKAYLRRRWRRQFAAEWEGSFEGVLLSGLARGGEEVVDIGAAEGVMSWLFAQHFKSVEAFEPNPRQFMKLEITADSNVSTHHLALSDERGAAVLSVPVRSGAPLDSWGSLNGGPETEAAGDSSRMESFSIETRRLDDFGFDDVGLIKIDVEGHEDRVVAGALETINRCSPLLYIEIEHRHRDAPVSTLVEKLNNVGYDSYFLQDCSLYPFDHFSPDVHQATDSAASEYVNNFLFIHRDEAGERREQLRSIGCTIQDEKPAT